MRSVQSLEKPLRMEVSGKGLVTPWVRLPLSSDASGPGQDFHKTGQTGLDYGTHNRNEG